MLAMQSVFEESLPRPSVDAVRGEMMPSCWILQPIGRSGQEATRVIYLLQVSLCCCKHNPKLPYDTCVKTVLARSERSGTLPVTSVQPANSAGIKSSRSF